MRPRLFSHPAESQRSWPTIPDLQRWSSNSRASALIDNAGRRGQRLQGDAAGRVDGLRSAAAVGAAAVRNTGDDVGLIECEDSLSRFGQLGVKRIAQRGPTRDEPKNQNDKQKEQFECDDGALVIVPQTAKQTRHDRPFGDCATTDATSPSQTEAKKQNRNGVLSLWVRQS